VNASPAPPRAPSQALPLAAVVFGASTLALAPILVRLSDTGPAAAGFWRLAFALPLLLLIGVRSDPRRDIGTPPKFAVLAGVFFVLDLACWHYGIVMTSVVNATTLCNLTPIVVTIAAWLLFRERPKALFVVAMLVAIGGAVVMATAKGAGGTGTNPPLGDLLSLATALWYGSYFLAVRQARTEGATATRTMIWATAAGAPLLLLVSIALREPLTPSHAAGWAACAGLGLAHVLGQGSVAWALGRLPASITAVTILIQPLVAAALSWAVFGEAVGTLQAVGGALVLGGVVLAQRSAATAKPVVAAD
jgi:drug/metabolite transporter (DMT)-like permease